MDPRRPAGGGPTGTSRAADTCANLAGMWNTSSKGRAPKGTRAAELASQLEDLLHQVWECERWWSVQDRLDLAARIEAARRGGVSDVTWKP